LKSAANSTNTHSTPIIPVACTYNVLVRVRVTLQLTVSQSVRLGVEPRLGLMTRYLIIYLSFESYCPVCMGRPLWREDGSVICLGQSVVMSFVSIYTLFTSTSYQLTYLQYVQGLCQSRLGTAVYALFTVATATTAF
jgi:hypothetical protein